MYYGKIADELIRYNRIKSFIFEPSSYLSFSKVKYNLNDDEIIILQSLITQEYFENLDAIANNIYIKNNTYDTSIPNISQYYSNEINVKELPEAEEAEPAAEAEAEPAAEAEAEAEAEAAAEAEPEEAEAEADAEAAPEAEAEPEEPEKKDISCPINKKSLLGKWKPFFPPNTIELFYTCEVAICTYELILIIIQDHNKEKVAMTKVDLKNELINIYKPYVDYFPLIFKILESQGKGTLIKKVRNREINFDDLLLSDHYYLTNLDLCLIAVHYKIPLVLLSSTTLIENNEPMLVVYSTDNTNFYFVKTPGVRAAGYPVQRLIYPSTGAKIDITKLSPDFQKDIKSKINNNFTNEYITNYEKRKRRKLVIAESKIGGQKEKIGKLKLE